MMRIELLRDLPGVGKHGETVACEDRVGNHHVGRGACRIVSYGPEPDAPPAVPVPDEPLVLRVVLTGDELPAAESAKGLLNERAVFVGGMSHGPRRVWMTGFVVSPVEVASDEPGTVRGEYRFERVAGEDRVGDTFTDLPGLGRAAPEPEPEP